MKGETKSHSDRHLFRTIFQSFVATPAKSNEYVLFKTHSLIYGFLGLSTSLAQGEFVNYIEFSTTLDNRKSHREGLYVF